MDPTPGASDPASAPLPAPPSPPPPPAFDGGARPKRKGGGNASRSRTRRLERQVAELRAKLEADPFAEDVRGGSAGQAAGADAPPTDASPAPAAPPVDEVPPLGIEGARAMAPAYYGVLNFATGFLIAKAPLYAGKPEEAARVAKAMQLDASGHYEGVGDAAVLKDASSDRMAIDPALIPVLAKVRLTPEWALVIVTFGVLGAKWAAATGDPDVKAAMAALG